MQAINDNATAFARADAQLRADAAVALTGIRALKENLATLAAVVEKLERQSQLVEGREREPRNPYRRS